MMIRTANQFNPVFVPRFSSPPAIGYVPPVALRNIFDDSTRGKEYRFSLQSENGLNFFEYNNSGMDECPIAISPAYEVYSVNVVGLVGTIISGVIIDSNPPQWLSALATDLPGRQIGVADIGHITLPASVTDHCFRYVVNAFCKFFPRWQYPDGTIIVGAFTPFSGSFLVNWGGYSEPSPVAGQMLSTIPLVVYINKPTGNPADGGGNRVVYPVGYAEPVGYIWDTEFEGNFEIWQTNENASLSSAGMLIGDENYWGTITSMLLAGLSQDMNSNPPAFTETGSKVIASSPRTVHVYTGRFDRSPPNSIGYLKARGYDFFGAVDPFLSPIGSAPNPPFGTIFPIYADPHEVRQ